MLIACACATADACWVVAWALDEMLLKDKRFNAVTAGKIASQTVCTTGREGGR